MSLDQKKAEWKRHLDTVPSTLSEIFLWFIREVSTAEIQQDFEQVFCSHILQNQASIGPYLQTIYEINYLQLIYVVVGWW
jgi:hypothetical protein